MKFSQDFFAEGNRIHAYDEESVTIQTKDNSELVVVSKSFIVNSQQIIQDWPINSIADFTSDDINYFNNLGIEVLLLSQNNTFSLASQLKPEVLIAFSQSAIGVEQMTLGSACRTFNLLISEGRQVALAVNF